MNPKMRPLQAIVFGICFVASSAAIAGDDSDTPKMAGGIALAGDVAAGKKLYRRNCRAWHGATGKGASSYPKLVGHPAEYLIDKVVRYRAGEKFGPNTPLMAQRVKKLSDQEIADVTAFIVSLEDS